MSNENLGNIPQNQIPLLLWHNSIEKIIDYSSQPALKYDYLNQVVEFDCATVGTKCMKASVTRKAGNTQDTVRKNVIDDSKTK
jgi:hypothetical protein